jgi:hypothetical protein
MTAEFLPGLKEAGRTVISILRTDQYVGLDSFSDIGSFVPLHISKQGTVLREVAPASIALALPEQKGHILQLRVALIRDLRRQVPLPDMSFPRRFSTWAPCWIRVCTGANAAAPWLAVAAFWPARAMVCRAGRPCAADGSVSTPSCSACYLDPLWREVRTYTMSLFLASSQQSTDSIERQVLCWWRQRFNSKRRKSRGDVLSKTIVKKGILLMTNENAPQQEPAWPKPNEKQVLQICEQRCRDLCGPAKRRAGRPAFVSWSHLCLCWHSLCSVCRCPISTLHLCTSQQCICQLTVLAVPA